jgi:spoIIIJ-associated protein
MTLREFLNLFIQSSQFQLEVDIIEDETQVKVNFTGEDSGLLLARMASPLYALEYLCNRLFEGHKEQIIVDCNNYRGARVKELKLMAVTAAETVQRTGDPLKLSPMSPEERRIVHLTVSNSETIRTESEGYNENRRVVFYPR